VKKLFLLLIALVTLVLTIHIWIDIASFKEWTNGYGIIYVGMFSILASVWKEKTRKLEQSKSTHNIVQNDCIEINDHFHWIGRISSTLFFVLFQVFMTYMAYLVINGPDSSSRSIRHNTGLLYIGIPLFTLGFIYYHGIAFYMRNKKFNRNIFLCEDYIYYEYPSKKIFGDEIINKVRIDIKDIECIAFSPMDRDFSETQKKGFKKYFEFIINHIFTIPFHLLYLIVKSLYYLKNGFSFRFFFKTIILKSDKDHLLIQIKSIKDYQQLNQYFNKHRFDLTQLERILSDDIYYVKNEKYGE